MKLGRNTIWLVALVLIGAVLLLAWYDGGRQEQRMIVEPVAVSGAQS
ncbi:hypothetical protein GRI62_05070 [Erythrobacter arachoides]|uniref:Uncharacterized protein n=1 Tax=Aurantiacibacter arachoides TaxID=1850444 RepID=A0A845A1G9_9SPHN|nr:hypothetical protein [Aurantiacibacter arachoides]MXO92976.1 hypothetical protein [Aurantiacibacter arachoides]